MSSTDTDTDGAAAAMEESATTDAAAAATLSTPAGKSPPGMSLRSGRKKRRRSKETTGLTPPEDTPIRKKRAKKQKAQQEQEAEEDVDMEQAEDVDMEDDNEEDETPSATTMAAATAAAQEVLKPQAKRVAPVAKLRMPSQHTPGKKSAETITTSNAATTVSSVAAAPPTSGAYAGTRKLLFGTTTAAAATTKKNPTPASVELESILAQPSGTVSTGQPTPTGRHDALPRNLARTASDALLNFTSSVQQVSTGLVVPQPERLQQQQQQGESPSSSSLPLDKTWAWMVVLLLLQLVLYQPVGSIIMASSQQATEFYQGFMRKPEVVVQEPTISLEEEEEEIPIPEIIEEEELEPLENPLVPLMATLESSMGSLQANTSAVQTDLNVVRSSLSSRKETLQEWNALLTEAERTVARVLEAVSEGREVTEENGQEALDKLEKMLETQPFPKILDTNVPLWEEATPTSCQPASPTSHDAVLTETALKQNEHGLKEIARVSAKTLRRNPDNAWLKEQVAQVMEKHSAPETPKTAAAVELQVGVTNSQLQQVITDRLEVELADQTGRIDYASLRHGASVIASATSPSLVDKLPLWNRLMAKLHLRFYGHGPEAALTPTFPVDALGQCWSFEPDDSLMGEHGTLSVRLARPIQVKSVVVEHAPKELTQQIQSAVREFRVIGFEDDAAASGTRYNLGSFQYDIDHDRSLQEFTTATTTADGEPIPKLRSITLAIDNNYGFDYSCVYRFRVQGDP